MPGSLEVLHGSPFVFRSLHVTMSPVAPYRMKKLWQPVLLGVAMCLAATQPFSIFSQRTRAQGWPIPDDLWVVPFNTGRPAEMVLAESLQGLTGRDSPKLWLDKRAVMSAVVLQQLRDEGTRVHEVDTVWDLPDEFWRAVDGAIVYSLGSHSLNVAISLCGPWNAVAVDESILGQAQAKGLAVMYDVRGQSEDRIFVDYFELFSPGIAVEQTETKPAYLRDFAVQNNAFTFYGFDSMFRRRVAAAFGPGATIFGWGPSEFTWISDFSRSSGQGVAADWCVNLSALSKLPVDL